MKMTVDPHKPGEIKVRGRERPRKPNYNEIAAMAYQMYEQEGRPAGKDLEHWYKAEAIFHSGGEDATKTGGSGNSGRR